jgi:hypothetical protein
VCSLCISAAGLGSAVSSLSGGRGTVNLLTYNSNAERPGDCESRVFIAKDDGVGDESENTSSVDLDTPLVTFLVSSTLEGYSSAAEVLGFLEDQHLD